MRRPRSAVGTQAGQLALSFNDFRVCIEDFCEFAMQADADVSSLSREFVHQALRGAHDEFEMRDVVALVRSNHQKFILLRRASMQSISSVEHENLERCDPVFRDE